MARPWSAVTQAAGVAAVGMVVLGLTCLWPVLAAPAQDGRAAKPAQKQNRSNSEVAALIADAGKTAPDWWDSVQLVIPQGLDLTWQNAPKGAPWQPNKYLGAHIISVINPNPAKWRPGIKLLHHVMALNKDDPRKLQQSMQALGQAYFNFEQDHARAAYWIQRSKAPWLDLQVVLAECYWRLGSRPMAFAALTRLRGDSTREGRVIKMLAEMGDLSQALRLAEAKARSGMADAAYLAAGNACRFHGRYQDAARFYDEVLKVGHGSRDLKKNKERAQSGLEAMKLYQTLDLKRIPDGAYRDSSQGYRGPIEVEVVVKAGRIDSCKVTNHREDMAFTATTVIPERIVEQQGLKGVDAVTSATMSCDTIMNAAVKALAAAKKN